MSNFADIATRLSNALTLTTAPVAVSFTNEIPSGHTSPKQSVAAGCKFWELGAGAAITTDATDHKHCAIGIHTHNIAEAPPSQGDELAATLAAMQGLDYVRREEVALIPVLEQQSRYVSYSPLSECNDLPATTLLFANAEQSLVITEAIARVDEAVPTSLGRPACALIPQVVNSGRSAASLGCCGARAYLDALDANTTIWALNGDKLNEYTEAIETLATANRTLSKFHEIRRIDIEKGANPSVNESLERLMLS